MYSAIRKKDPDIPLILAEEIMTIDGEIIGAFLTEEISPGQSAEETLDEIRSQGGISILPHPFCTYRRSAITSEARERISGDIDCIEGYNARILRETENIKAVMHARKYSKPVSVGSDAHTPFELGISYVTLAPFSTQYDLLKNLRAGAIVFRMTNPKIHYITKVVKAVKLLQPGFSL
ncbi:MAG TPA: PHP-associated domain-containing protein [Methanoregulaceae archaeon]|nr:PHP-associated domain-containing protein [Methanoregulaceae archaeon]